MFSFRATYTPLPLLFRCTMSLPVLFLLILYYRLISGSHWKLFRQRDNISPPLSIVYWPDTLSHPPLLHLRCYLRLKTPGPLLSFDSLLHCRIGPSVSRIAVPETWVCLGSVGVEEVTWWSLFEKLERIWVNGTNILSVLLITDVVSQHSQSTLWYPFNG